MYSRNSPQDSVGIIIPIKEYHPKPKTPGHSCLLGTHSKMQLTRTLSETATALSLLGRKLGTSSTAVLPLLFWRSTGVHVLVHVRVEYRLTTVIRLWDLLLFWLSREELVLWLLLLLRWLGYVSLLRSSRLWFRVVWSALVLGRRVLPRDNVDEEVEHVRLAQRGGDVTALQSTALVLLGVDPGAHGELGDEGLAGFGEDDRRFGGDHLDFWVGLHDLLDARERQLVDLVVVVLRLEHRHDLLPVGVEDVAVVARAEALGDLNRDALVKVLYAQKRREIRYGILTLPQWPLKVSGGGAWPWAAMPALAP
jgi:hypothetical protein